jgi:hypothetical protein
VLLAWAFETQQSTGEAVAEPPSRRQHGGKRCGSTSPSAPHSPPHPGVDVR